METRLSELVQQMKEAAAKATPGLWRSVALLADAENHHVLAGKFSDRHIKATADDHNGLVAFADLPANTDYIAISNPANVSALLAERDELVTQNERLQLAAEAAVRNAETLDRIRLWSKCADGYPLDEHINNIATTVERQAREISELSAQLTFLSQTTEHTIPLDDLRKRLGIVK